MNIGRCPVCHHHLSLQAMEMDEATKELLALMAKTPHGLARALLTYLGLFRSAKRDLANDRALRLAQDVLALTTDPYLLTAALAETSEAIFKKRQGGECQPLKNHNYLKQVLASVADRVAQPVPVSVDQPEAPKVIERDENEAWRRQMARYGVDVDQFRTTRDKKGKSE